MTAEKHPLEMVRDALERSREMEYNPFEPDNQSAHYNKLKEALTTLNHYLCQKQSCAECERLGMENADMRKELIFYADPVNYKAVIRQSKPFEINGKMRTDSYYSDPEVEHDGGERARSILEKVLNSTPLEHAATIAAAGGE